MNLPIGGYFSLELPKYEEYHKDSVKLNTGRNCLEYILRIRRYRKVYIPYYTCEVILEPLKKLDIQYEFYHINPDLELADGIYLQQDEAILYTNYFGLKQRYIGTLSEKFGQQLIVDNTQAFYAKPIKGIDTFYTCRKFFGVPDGAYLYVDKLLDNDLKEDTSWRRMSFLTKRIDLGAEAGYADFQELGKSLVGQPIKKMSNLTERLMRSVDYGIVKKSRQDNFALLHEALKDTNQFDIDIDADAVPMVYPYLTDGENLRKHLIQNKIFVAKYWPNVLNWCKQSDIEYMLTSNTVCLPVDQRYGEEEMEYIISIISKKIRL